MFSAYVILSGKRGVPGELRRLIQIPACVFTEVQTIKELRVFLYQNSAEMN